MAGGSSSIPLLWNWEEERETAGVLTCCSKSIVVEAIDMTLQGILIGSIIAATYLLAWGKAGSVCTPANNGPVPTWVQAVISSLPFTVIIPAIYFSGALKNAVNACRPLSYTSTISLIQVCLSILLGAWFSFCMLGVTLKATMAAALSQLLAVGFTWGFSFDRAVRLKAFLRSKWGRMEGEGLM